LTGAFLAVDFVTQAAPPTALRSTIGAAGCKELLAAFARWCSPPASGAPSTQAVQGFTIPCPYFVVLHSPAVSADPATSSAGANSGGARPAVQGSHTGGTRLLSLSEFDSMRASLPASIEACSVRVHCMLCLSACLLACVMSRDESDPLLACLRGRVGTTAQVFLGFVDPASSPDHPGWPARNLLVLAGAYCMSRHVG